MSEKEMWMSIEAAAELLGVGRRAVHKYIQQGKVQAFKAPVGGRTLLKRADVEALKIPRPLHEPKAG